MRPSPSNQRTSIFLLLLFFLLPPATPTPSSQQPTALHAPPLGHGPAQPAASTLAINCIMPSPDPACELASTPLTTTPLIQSPSPAPATSTLTLLAYCTTYELGNAQVAPPEYAPASTAVGADGVATVVMSSGVAPAPSSQDQSSGAACLAQTVTQRVTVTRSLPDVSLSAVGTSAVIVTTVDKTRTVVSTVTETSGSTSCAATTETESRAATGMGARPSATAVLEGRAAALAWDGGLQKLWKIGGGGWTVVGVVLFVGVVA